MQEYLLANFISSHGALEMNQVGFAKMGGMGGMGMGGRHERMMGHRGFGM